MEANKTLREKMAQMKTLTIDAEEKTFDKKERSITHWISKSVLDRGKDVVLPDSLDLTNYKKNPIVLFNHNANRPVARNAWVKTEDDGALAKSIFGTTPDADDIYLLNTERILNAWSIGFIPKKKEYDEEENIITYTDIELLEYSSVSIPMNQDAVTEGLKMVKSMEIKSILEKQAEETKVKIEIESFKKELNELRDLYNKLSELTSKDYIEDLEKAEREILELKAEIELIKNKLSTGTLDSRKVFDEALKNAIGDVS